MKNRDDRDYDIRRINCKRSAQNLARTYSASFFRWSFARRFVSQRDDVLEIGCGADRPLFSLLTGGPAARVNTYLGVDICELKQTNNMRCSFIGEFNFVERWQELWTSNVSSGFDVIIHLEVIEHMRVKFGEELLHGCHKLLRPDGKMLMSTPVFDGKKQLFGHVHEYTVEELQELLEKTGFTVEQRFGTYMYLKYLNNNSGGLESATIGTVRDKLKKYYDNDALSCIFAPLFPDYAKNCLWVCEKA